MCAAVGADAAVVLGRARLVAAIGKTTAEALAARGLRVDVVPAAPTAEELAAALVTALAGKDP